MIHLTLLSGHARQSPRSEQIEALARQCASEHTRQGWDGDGADYDLGYYHGDREALEAAFEKPTRGEYCQFETAIRRALDLAWSDSIANTLPEMTGGRYGATQEELKDALAELHDQ